MSEALKDLAAYAKEKLDAQIQDAVVAYGELNLLVEPGDIIDVLNFLKSDVQCQFVSFIDISGADYPSRERRFDVVYHLLSPRQNQRIRVKVATDEETPVPSVVEIFPAAGWYEREVYDLYGVLFTGHPDLRRILTDYVYTLSTTTGQAKGSAEPAADPGAQLPVPYKENFERAGSLGLARYFSDVHGGFAAAPCEGRRGTCYEQQVPAQPLSWHGVNLPPTTMVGDPRWWGDYEVGVDARLDQAGSVELLGRVDSQQHNASGYHLKVSDTGAWSLFTQDVQGRDRTLASGTVAGTGTVGVDAWHRLGLRFQGEEISALLDGQVLATVRDASHTTGQAGLRVGGWQRAQFDNVSVTPTRPWPAFVRHSGMTATASSEHAANDFGHSYPARHAIDDRLWSTWRSEYSPLEPLPQSLTLDLGAPTTVAGVTYTPAVTSTAGAVTAYTVYTSADGRTFSKAAEGFWEATLATKTAPLPRPVRARYVRLEAGSVNGCPRSTTAAEIGVSRTVLPALGVGTPPDDDVPRFPHVVPQSEMTASATSHQPGYEAGKAIDGNCATMWHESWSPYTPPPQSLTLDLGNDYQTIAMQYQPRQDGNPNGVITSYAIEVSQDGTTYSEVAAGTWAADGATKTVEWPATAAHHVRLVAKAGGNGHVSAAEITVAHTGE